MAAPLHLPIAIGVGFAAFLVSLILRRLSPSTAKRGDGGDGGGGWDWSSDGDDCGGDGGGD